MPRPTTRQTFALLIFYNVAIVVSQFQFIQFLFSLSFVYELYTVLLYSICFKHSQERSADVRSRW